MNYLNENLITRTSNLFRHRPRPRRTWSSNAASHSLKSAVNFGNVAGNLSPTTVLLAENKWIDVKRRKDSVVEFIDGSILFQDQFKDASHLNLSVKLNARIAALEEAIRDDGDVVIPDSKRALMEFISRLSVQSMPMISWRPGGLLRAVWKKNSDQLGVTFVKSNRLNYVILKSINLSPEINQHFGSTDTSDLSGILFHHGLLHLLA